MLLVTCKEVIEDLIKNGSNRKHLVSHMTGTLEWGSSIIWVLTWRTKFFPFSALPLLGYWLVLSWLSSWSKIVSRILLHADDHFCGLKGNFCVSLFRRKKTFLKCIISWLTFTSYWLVIVWHTSAKHRHWKSSMVDLELRFTLGGQRGAQHLKHSAASYLEKTLAFWASQKGKMCLVVSWLGSQLSWRPEPRVQVSKCGIPVSPNIALEGMERLLEKLGDRSQAGPLLILDIILFLNFFQLSSSYQSIELLTPISLLENTHTHTTHTQKSKNKNKHELEL